MNQLRARIGDLKLSEKKWQVFILVVVVVGFLGTLLSILTKYVFIEDDAAARFQVAVVVPPGQQNAMLSRGVALYLETYNSQAARSGRVEAIVHEENEALIAKLASDTSVIGVVGFNDIALLEKAAQVFAERKLPLVTPRMLPAPIPGVMSLGLDDNEQARFAGNYARNIVQQRLMYVVREAGSQFDPLVAPFLDVYERFETPVRKVWTLTDQPGVEADIKAAAKVIGELGIGALYVATNPDLAARVVAEVRATGAAIEIFGPSQLAANAFVQQLMGISGKQAAVHNHGIVAASPLIFDTANEDAQRFRTRFQQLHQTDPDWVAALGHDSAGLALAAHQGQETFAGVSGELVVGSPITHLPIKMGAYNGADLISAPVQLQPLNQGAGFNYIEALRQGRVLYVNDRFMYRTNVVYVGLAVHSIGEFDFGAETAKIDFSIWFRYRGNFSPQDILLLNGAEPLELKEPEAELVTDDVQYRRFRVNHTIQMNFTDKKRSFGQHIAGLTFRHRDLNRSNLLYVVDVLGMPTGDELVDDLQSREVVSKASGWKIDSAWISQDMVQERGDGAPQYTGMTGELPLYSAITFGALVKSATPTARDFISSEYLIYIAIFGILGAMSAYLMDAGVDGRRWAVQSWLLRLMFWPLMLLSAGNLFLNWAFVTQPPATMHWIILVYSTLWWLVFAWLADMAVRRFIWNTLEQRTDNKIPDVMKFFITSIIFGLAAAGATAFVFDEPLTSMLATSGVLAMIVGFAVQANIANVFSGIILNIERPFKVGDYVKIDEVCGLVKDITWRTIRIESNSGQLICLANSEVSEALMENYSQVPHGINEDVDFFGDPNVDPDVVIPIIHEAVMQAPDVIMKDVPPFDPQIIYHGVENIDSVWAARFRVSYRIRPPFPANSDAKHQIWTYARKRFVEEGVELNPEGGGGDDDE